MHLQEGPRGPGFKKWAKMAASGSQCAELAKTIDAYGHLTQSLPMWLGLGGLLGLELIIGEGKNARSVLEVFS